ncbi:Fukutin [Araneus ventricosus]|uniref:Fukutin n=1 Tax=Araneus ventricosus TaxID=182803 RepID=A0A4Y2F080_ARAVE|nr:Fukutin [Araneus ventricosus]
MIHVISHRLRVPGLANYGFLILLIVCFSVFTSFVFLSQGDIPGEEHEDDLEYSQKTIPPFRHDILDENFEKCILAPLTSDHLLGGTNSSVGNLLPEFPTQTMKATFKVKKSPVFPILKRFTDLMSSFFRIETVLIEPSVLFCMLGPRYKNLLLRRNFHLKSFANTKRVLTLGIRGTDVAEFEKPGTQAKLRAYGFRMELVNESLLPWMQAGNWTFFDDHFTSHVFFKTKDWVIHLVPFYERGDFLWHASLDVNKNYWSQELYFAESDSIYENFTYESLNFKASFLININIPSNPQYFLFETMNSKFLECNSTVVSSYFKSNQTGVPKISSFSIQYINKRVEVGLQELKSIFNPLLMNFWMWSGTMLGWHRQCGVIPYTTDADFAVWASEVDDLDDILQRIEKNDHVELKQRMGIVEQSLEFNLNCHKLRVDVFFLYPESNGTWYAGHRPSKGYYFKYHHPNFSLCSAELLGHKVLVPCETEQVIATEYGSNWMQPVAEWDYENSIKNRGPNIYWNKSMLEKQQKGYFGTIKPLNFELWSEGEDDILLSKLHNTQAGGRLTLDIRFIGHMARIHGRSLVESGFRPETLRSRSRALTTRSLRPHTQTFRNIFLHFIHKREVPRNLGNVICWY